MSIRPCIYDPSRPCICHVYPQDLTECWFAIAYRKSVQPKWYERIFGRIVVFVMGRW